MQSRPSLGFVTFLLGASLVGAWSCVGDDPTPARSTNDIDAGMDAGSPATGADAAPPDTGVADGGGTTFCQSSAAAGAAFCADFESSTTVKDGWDGVLLVSSPPVVLNTALGYQSNRSATLKLDDAANAQAYLVKSVTAGKLVSGVRIEYDVMFTFPAWPAGSYNEFVLGTLNTQADASTAYPLSFERRPDDWKVFAGDGSHVAGFPTSTFDAGKWYHVEMAYTGGTPSLYTLTVDASVVGSLVLPDGPAKLDGVVLSAGLQNRSNNGTKTEVTLDNVVVRFQ